MTSHADVLGVDTRASDEEIEAAYRSQVRRFHPDRFDPDEVAAANADRLDPNELFRDVKRARDTLTGAGGAPSDALHHEWSDGEPIVPGERESPDERVAGNRGRDANGGSTGESVGGPAPGASDGDGATAESDGDGPWGTGDPGASARVDETIGVEIDDGATESVSTGRSRSGPDLSRRGILAIVGVGGAGLVGATRLWPDGGGPDRTEERVVADPSSSLQAAADSVVPGGTLELESGTYADSLRLDADVTVSAPAGATIVGDGSDGPAIAIGAETVDIEGLTIVDVAGGAIHGGSPESRLSLSNVTAEGCGDVAIDLAGETVTVDEVTVRETAETGISVTSTDGGTVDVAGVVATDNADSGYTTGTVGRGISIRGGADVTIRESEVIASGLENVAIEPGPAGGQTVVLEDVTVAESATRSGIAVPGSRGDDSITMRNVRAVENDRDGVVLGADHAVDEATLSALDVARNGYNGIDVSLADTAGFELSSGEIEGHQDALGSHGDNFGVRIVGGERVVLAETTVAESSDANVRIDGGGADGQSIELREVTALSSERESGVRIDGTRGADDVSVSGLESADNDRSGARIGADNPIEELRLESLQVADNGHVGIDLVATDSGTVTLTGATVERHLDSLGSHGDNYGVRIAGGERVVLAETTVAESSDANLLLEGGGADGQSIELREVTALSSERDSGVRVEGTRGTDAVAIERSSARDNAAVGFDLAGETVRIVDSAASGNADGALRLRDIDREDAEIIRSFQGE